MKKSAGKKLIQNIKTFLFFVVTLVITILVLTYIMPFRETLSCFKAKNICEINSEYLFRNNIEYLSLDKLKNVNVKLNFSGHGRQKIYMTTTYSITYVGNNDVNLNIFIGEYYSKLRAEDAKASIMSFLNSSQNSFVLTRYEIFGMILASIFIFISLFFIVLFLLGESFV